MKPGFKGVAERLAELEAVNGRLLKANTKLLAALKEAQDLLSDGPGGPRRLSAMRLIYAAITKAESK